MSPRELIDELLSLGLPPETARLSLRLILRVLRDRVYEFRLTNGSHMHDTMDVKEYFGQAVELLTPPAADADPGRAGLRVSQFDWPQDDTCPACSHVHIGVLECAVDMGGGGKCDCRLKVPA